MTLLTVTLENGADSNHLRKMIESMKGVVKVSLHHKENKKYDKATQEWVDTLHSLKSQIDPDLIDFDDEKTKYIMSK